MNFGCQSIRCADLHVPLTAHLLITSFAKFMFDHVDGTVVFVVFSLVSIDK